MYRLKPGVKQDPARRWALPDRVFFGHGACHILAGVYLSRPPQPGFYAERVLPGDGFAGNHIFVTNGVVAFDYHGCSKRLNLLQHHTAAWAKNSDPGWHCTLQRVDFDLLNTAALNARKMLGPDQYAGDPITRAAAFISRIDHARGIAKALHQRPADHAPSPGATKSLQRERKKP